MNMDELEDSEGRQSEEAAVASKTFMRTTHSPKDPKNGTFQQSPSLPNVVKGVIVGASIFWVWVRTPPPPIS